MSDVFLIPETRTKRVAAEWPYTIDFKAWLRQYWIAGRDYQNGSFVRSPSISGFAFQATNAGEAGQSEPAWPTVVGGSVVDGSITWQAVLPGVNATDAIQSVAWSQVNPPDGVLTISAEMNTNEEATATFGAGTSGYVYRIQCVATGSSGADYPVQFDLQVQ